MNPGWLAVGRFSDESRDRVAQILDDATRGMQWEVDRDALILSKFGEQAVRDGLTGRELDVIESFASSQRSALFLENLPQGHFPSTPVTGYGDERHMAAINALHLGIISLLGLVPFSVEYENEGRLVRNVVANPAASGTASSWGSDAEFFWHTDNPHLPFGDGLVDPRQNIPQNLVFYAIRNIEHVPTEVVPLGEVLNELDEPTLEALRAPEFTVRPAASNDLAGVDIPARPLLEQIATRTFVRFDLGATSARTPRAEKALQVWERTLRATASKGFVLKPGDLLVINNYELLHRRRGFTPAPRADSRWLRRCYAS